MNELYNDDCLNVMRKMADKSVDLVLTDPPYLVDWQSNRRMVKHDKIENDIDDGWLEPVFKEIYRVLKDDSLCVSFYGWPDADKFLIAFKDAGFKPKSHLVWVKNNIGLGWFTRGKHEQAYLLAKGSPPKPENAIADVLTWTGTGNEHHPTQKPVDALTPIIATYSEENNLIFDPFMGSGTTGVACKMLNRNFIGCEISKKYFDIAKVRIEKQTPPLF